MLYFAYGSNMHAPQMARRAPRARPLGIGRLDHHRIFFTSDGYAAVRDRRGTSVYGVVWRIEARDVAALDRFEGVDEGWYVKRIVPIRMAGATVSCLVYHGGDVSEGLRPRRRYFHEAVVGSALAWNLPARYIDGFSRFARHGFRG